MAESGRRSLWHEAIKPFHDQTVQGDSAATIMESEVQWDVHNFFLCPQRSGESLNSPPFTAGWNRELQFCLELYPYGWGNEKYVGLYLKLLSCKYATVYLECFLSFGVREEEGVTGFSFKGHMVTGDRYGNPRMVTREEIVKRYLRDGTLTINSELSAVVTVEQFAYQLLESKTHTPK